MVKDMNSCQMALNFKVISKMALNKAKEHSSGVMVKFIKANGIMVKNMVVVYGKGNTTKNTLDNGNITQQKGLVCSFHPMVTDTKESLKIQQNMDMVLKDIIMEKHMQVSLNRIDQMVKESIIGRMAAFIKESLLINLDMDRDIIQPKITKKFIKESSEMIKNVDQGN